MGAVYYRSDVRIMPPNPEPRILISGELLGLFERWPSDDARLERGEDGGIVGGVLRLNYNGVRTIYCIKEVAEPKWDPYREAIYAAEWPD